MNPAVEPVVLASAVSKSFPPLRRGGPPVPVLHDVSLAVSPGEFVAIVGPSGSGKSTLLYCLAGLEPVSAGGVRLLGHDLAGLSRNRAAAVRRDGVGFVFQSFNLIPSLSARENVALPARLARRRIDADAALAAVGLERQAGHLPSELSGGQQQRVAVARVLAMRPRVVFADEPTGSLDGETGARVLDLMQSAAAAGSAVVLVTHDLEAAARADRVVVLRDGSVHGELRGATAADVFRAVSAAREAVLR